MAERNFSFSIFFSLLGIGGGFALALIGIFAAPEALEHLYQPRGYAVMIGGLAGTAALAFPASRFQQNALLLWDILTGGLSADRQGLLKESLMLATRSRETPGQEQKFYREIKPYLAHRILQSGLDLLISGYERKMLQRSLQTRIQQHLGQHDAAIHMFRSLMHAAWLWGAIAALSGALRIYLVYNAPGRYFAGVAAPFILGLVLSLMLFYPLLKQIERHRLEYEQYLQMSTEAIVLLQEHHHPHYVESVLRAYLPIEVQAAPVQRPQTMSVQQVQAAQAQRAQHYEAPPVQETQNSPPSGGFQAVLEREHIQPQSPGQPRQSAPRPSQARQDSRNLSADQLRRFRPVRGDQNHP